MWSGVIFKLTTIFKLTLILRTRGDISFCSFLIHIIYFNCHIYHLWVTTSVSLKRSCYEKLSDRLCNLSDSSRKNDQTHTNSESTITRKRKRTEESRNVTLKKITWFSSNWTYIHGWKRQQGQKLLLTKENWQITEGNSTIQIKPLSLEFSICNSRTTTSKTISYAS